VAEALLTETGLGLASLRAEIGNWPEPERVWLVRELGATVQMSLTLTEPAAGAMVNVLGYLPGKDIALDDQLVLVGAHYDSLPPEVDGTLYPAANSDASGVAVMLEVARLWHEQGFEPRRTMIFAAWAGGTMNPSGAEGYFDAYLGGLSLLRPAGIFQLDKLGAGGEALWLSSGSERLLALMDRSADQLGIPVESGQGVYHRYQGVVNRQGPAVLVSWQAEPIRPPDDRPDLIEPEKLRIAGEVINLALINIAREAQY
jgi:hypothetical protein